MKTRNLFIWSFIVSLLLSALLSGRMTPARAAAESLKTLNSAGSTARVPFGHSSVVSNSPDAKRAPAAVPKQQSGAPTITEVSPAEGTNNLTTTITILGSNFSTTGTPTVTLGVTPLLNVRVLSSTVLIADVPMSATLGTYDVIVSNPGGESGMLANAFEVVDFEANTADVTQYFVDSWVDTSMGMTDILYRAPDNIWGLLTTSNPDDSRLFELDLSEATPDTSNGLYLYQEPHPGGMPFDLVDDGNGGLWWTQGWQRWAGGGRIGRATVISLTAGTSDGIVEYPVTGSWRDTDGITVDENGNIWFTQRSDDEVVKAVPSEVEPDTSTGLYDYLLPGASSWPNHKGASGIIADGEGNLWILLTAASAEKIVKVVISETTPGTSNGFYEYPLPVSAQGPSKYYFARIKMDAAGNIWSNLGTHLVKFVPVEMIVGTMQGMYTYPIPSENAEFSEVEFSSDGRVWLVEPDAQKIAVFDPTRAISGTSRGFTEYAILFSPTTATSPHTAMDDDGNFWFTGSISDTRKSLIKFAPQSPFIVTATNPANAAHNVAPDATISADLSQPVDFSSITTRTFTVRGSQTGIYTGTYTPGSAVFDPAYPFKPGEEVMANLSNGIESTGGVLLAPYAWQFRASVKGGSGVFTETRTFGGSDYLGEIKFADVDNDNDLDLIAAASHWHQSHVYLNDGSGDFSTSRNFGRGSDNAVSMAAGDFDNDGDLDIALGQWNSQNDIYLNDGNGNFSLHTHFDIAGYSHSMVSGDVDSDGDLDIVVANNGEQSAVYLNDGFANFSKGDNLGPGNWGGRGLAIGDMDNDGDLDIVLGHSSTSELPRLFLNNGTGQFPISRTVGISPANTLSLATGDLDNDGDLDLAVGNHGNEPSFVLFNDGAGHFLSIHTFENGADIEGISTLSLGDVDADGDLDLLAGSGGWGVGQSKLHYNNGSGHFNTSWYLGGQTHTDPVALGDIDNDGDLDIAAGRFLGQINEIYVNYGQPVMQPTLSIISPNTTSVGNPVSVAVTLNHIAPDNDLRGLQFSLRVSDTGILTPASAITPTMGNFFPGNSITSVTAVTEGWNFLLTAPLSPTAAASGSGTVITLPFTAQGAGCVDLSFTDHRLSNGNAQPIPHTAGTASVCVEDAGNISGSVYLDWRSEGHYTGTQLTLVGATATYTATATPQGDFRFTGITAGGYILQANHDLFVQAVRTLTVSARTTSTARIGLWAGDIDQDQNVTLYDWSLLAAAIYPVEDPAFDIDDDGLTDVYDLMRLEKNRGQSDMTATNPPPRSARRFDSAKAEAVNNSSADSLTLVPQGNGEILLRLEKCDEPVQAIGSRINLPAGIRVSEIVPNESVTGGFLKWHQAGDSLYIVVASPSGQTIAQGDDVLTIRGASEASMMAQNIVLSRKFKVYLPLIVR